MRIHKTLLAILALTATHAMAQQAGAQTPAPPISVFLDCHAHSCDSSHFRTEIAFVNWVRDRSDADVHLLITSQETGGGGTQYALTFFGLRAFVKDTVQTGFSTGQTATSAEVRDMLTNRIAQGLIHYSLNTAAMDRVLVTMRDAGDGDAPSQGLTGSARDPWNHWVFNAGLDGSTDGESQQSSKEFSMETNASRVTEEWKIEVSAHGSYRENRFELDDGTFRSVRRNYKTEGQVTKALAPLWSAGLNFSEGTSTFRNEKLYVAVASVLEYSFLPYSEFARRRITLTYAVGANHFRYAEVTLFDKLHETVFDEELQLSTRYQQPWGSAAVALSGSHYFQDIHRYELDADGDLNIRIIKGLTARIGAQYSRVHNQLYIQKGGASDQDVLLKRLALATGYQYRASFGVGYTFGSIYNNIVNRRID